MSANLAAMFQYLAESVQERAARRVEERREKGELMGPAPFGYRLVDGKHVPNPAEDLATVIETWRASESVPRRRAGA